MKQIIKNLSKRTFLISSIIFLILLSLTFILRYILTGSLSYIGEKAYYYLRLASEFSPIVKDELIVPNTAFFFDPTIIFYIPFQYFPQYISITIQFIIGIATILFVYKILSTILKKKESVFIVLLLLVLSPFFLYSFARLTPFIFISFISSLAIYLYLKNKKIISLLLFSLISFLSVHYLIGILSILFCLNKFTNKIFSNKKNSKYIKILAILGALYYLLIYLLNISPPNMYNFKFMQFTSLFTFLGDATGYGTFIILLAFLGLFILWKDRKEYWHMYLFVIIFLVYSLFFIEARIFLHIYLLFFSAYGLLYMIDRKWNLKLVKKFTLFVIFLGLLFSSLSFVDRESVHHPHLYIIKEISDQLHKGIILTDPDLGHVIQYYSKNPVLYTTTNPYDTEQSKILFSSRNIETTMNILERYNVDFIIITKDMEDKIFSEEQGLLFLLENSKRFKKIQSSSSVNIWMVIK